MKPERTNSHNTEPEEAPFLQERIICRINALIEVMNLPAEKLREINTTSTADKLQELSGGTTTCVTSQGQYFMLNFIIHRMCDNETSIGKVKSLGEEKLKYFLETQEMD